MQKIYEYAIKAAWFISKTTLSFSLMRNTLWRENRTFFAHNFITKGASLECFSDLDPSFGVFHNCSLAEPHKLKKTNGSKAMIAAQRKTTAHSVDDCSFIIFPTKSGFSMLVRLMKK